MRPPACLPVLLCIVLAAIPAPRALADDGPPDLSVTMSLDPTMPGTEGRDKVHSLTVENTGPGLATNVIIQFQTSGTIRSANPAVGCKQSVLEWDQTGNFNTHSVECAIGSMQADTFATLEVISNVYLTKDITTRAIVKAAEPDPNPANNVAVYPAGASGEGGTSVHLSDASGAEGDDLVFSARLSRASAFPVSFDFRTYDGSANSPSDYETSAGTLTFQPGETTKDISVPTERDQASEATEGLFLLLSGLVGPNAAFEDHQGVGTIAQGGLRPPDAPFRLTAAAGDSHIGLSWAVPNHDGGAPLTGYKIYRGTSPGKQGRTAIATAPPTATSYVDKSKSVQNGVRYFYTVAATNGPGTNGQGEGKRSNEASARPSDQDLAELGLTIAFPHSFAVPESTASGEHVERTITVENRGPSEATEIELTLNVFGIEWEKVEGAECEIRRGTGIEPEDEVPPGEINDAYQTTRMFQTHTCRLPGVPPDGFHTVRMAGQSDSVNHRVAAAKVTSSQPDSNLSNNFYAYENTATTFISAGDAGASEAGADKAVAFTATLAEPSVVPVTADYRTYDGTAISGWDYQPGRGTVVFNPGEQTKTVRVPISDDGVAGEGAETFYLVFSNASRNALFTDNQSVGTITDNTVSILSASRTEGSTGTATPMPFTIRLSGPSPVPVTVNYSTVAGTATAGSDYTTVAPTKVTIPAGSLSTKVNVPVVGDKIYEINETFKVKLSSPTGATLSPAYQATGTIVNDDPKPSLSVADIKFAEGNSGATNRLFTVKLSTPSGADTKVNYATANSSAIAGSDYTAKTGTLTIRKGATSATVPVRVTGDTVTEKNEIFYLKLSSAVNATISDATAAATILNDDSPAITISNVSLQEPDSATRAFVFKVKLSAPTTSNVTVSYKTTDGTAKVADSDYVARTPTTLTILAGRTEASVTVSVRGDTRREPNETFFVDLSSPTKATISGGRGQGTILNDD